MNPPDDKPSQSAPAVEAAPDCQDAVHQLYTYLDGELDHGTVERVKAHLERCSPCLDAYDFHADLQRVIASKCAQSMPDEVRAKLLAMFEEPPISS